MYAAGVIFYLILSYVFLSPLSAKAINIWEFTALVGWVNAYQ